MLSMSNEAILDLGNYVNKENINKIEGPLKDKVIYVFERILNFDKQQ